MGVPRSWKYGWGATTKTRIALAHRSFPGLAVRAGTIYRASGGDEVFAPLVRSFYSETEQLSAIRPGFVHRSNPRLRPQAARNRPAVIVLSDTLADSLTDSARGPRDEVSPEPVSRRWLD